MVLSFADSPPCPCVMLQEFCAVCTLLQLSLLVNEGGTPLTRYQFTALFRRSIASLGSSAQDYAAYCFRIGAASAAAATGFTALNICAIGRWRSAVFGDYIYPFTGLQSYSQNTSQMRHGKVGSGSNKFSGFFPVFVQVIGPWACGLWGIAVF